MASFRLLTMGVDYEQTPGPDYASRRSSYFGGILFLTTVPCISLKFVQLTDVTMFRTQCTPESGLRRPERVLQWPRNVFATGQFCR